MTRSTYFPLPLGQPPVAQPPLGQLGRRRFLQLLGAGAMAAVTGCSPRSYTELVPYVNQPVGVVPGETLHFATSLPFLGFGRGALIESVTGRPIKADGNPDHPATPGGGSDVALQSSLMDLYDPDRPDGPTRRGQPVGIDEMVAQLGKLLPKSGEGVHILTRTVASPTLAEAIAGLGPQARWHRWEPIWSASRGFTQPAHVHPRLSQVRTLVTFEQDALGTHPDRVRLAREWATGRRQLKDARFYAFEAAPTPTGAKADHRFALPPAATEAALWALAARFGLATAPSTTLPTNVLDAIEHDLKAGDGLVLVGETLSPGAQALGHRLNEKLGAIGKHVVYTRAVDEHPLPPEQSLGKLVQALNANQVKLLLILGGNPIYDSPSDSGFAAALSKAQVTLHNVLLPNETSAACQWMVPASHELEAWGDLRSFDGTVSLVQPLIEPLRKSLTAPQLLALLQGQPNEPYKLVRKNRDDQSWNLALRDGSLKGTAFPTLTPSPVATPASPPAGSDLVVTLAADFSVVDGEHANNPWLQELPRPLTKLVWGNAVQLSPATARQYGLENDDVVRLQTSAGEVEGPVYIDLAQADGTATVHLGYGRTTCGRIGTGVGFNAYPLRAQAALWWAPVKLTRTGKKKHLVSTQLHHRMEGRDPVYFGPADKIEIPKVEEATLLPGTPSGHSPTRGDNGDQPVSWGMVIDLTACVGCNACQVACQAENNIAVVGSDEVDRGRIMHWIRVDRYDTGPVGGHETPIQFEPVPCMHCEDAPCEKVCPVEATLHTEEGLNQMVYNRCVGTRYCSNNCPYKVRRFNFFRWVDPNIETWKMQRNPEVTVRDRGVMEKCSYCVQRIDAARIRADEDNRPIRDGEARTACEVACPAAAITFGNLADPESRVSKERLRDHRFELLAELGTRPRTTYLARVTNPSGLIPAEGRVEE